MAKSKEKERVDPQEARRQQAAVQQALQQTIKANPQFLDRIWDFDLGEDVEDTLGPLDSGAATLGQRDEHHATERKWLNLNKAERIIAEGRPGRLCQRDKRRALALGVANKQDTDALPERRAASDVREIRDALQRISNIETLSVDKALLKAMTESVAVTRTEDGDDGAAQKASRLLG